MPGRSQEDAGDALHDDSHGILPQKVEHHGLVCRVAPEPSENVFVERDFQQNRRDQSLHGPRDARGGVATERERKERAHRETRVREVAKDVLVARFGIGHARHDAAVPEASAPAVPDARVDDGGPSGSRGQGSGEGEEGQNCRCSGRAEQEGGEERPGEDKGEDLGEAEFICLFTLFWEIERGRERIEGGVRKKGGERDRE